MRAAVFVALLALVSGCSPDSGVAIYLPAAPVATPTPIETIAPSIDDLTDSPAMLP